MTPRTPPQLVLIDPVGARRPIPITKSPLTIGRLADNDVVLPDSRISRHHAVIEQENGNYVIRDEDSRHGTYVDGERVEAARILKSNDRIEFGVPGSYALLFVAEGESLEHLIERVDTPAGSATSQELRSLNLLLEVGRSLQAGLALEDVLATVVDACLKVTGTERGFLFLRGPKGEPVFRVGRNNKKGSLGPEHFQGRESEVVNTLHASEDIVVTCSEAEGTVIYLSLRRFPTVASLESTLTGFLPESLGVICLDNRGTSRPFTETDRQVLRSLAMEAAGVVENARLFTTARDKERLDRELAIARDIQQALLPKKSWRTQTFQVAGISIPTQQIGGDYYDWIEIPDGRYAFVVTDVSGKGISAALLSSTLQGALTAMVELGQPVDSVAAQLNRYLCGHSSVNRFATFFCGVLGPGGRFQYVNAGHMPPLLFPGRGDPTVLRAGSFPVGLLEEDFLKSFEEKPFAAQELHLGSGDTLILYTDGFVDALNAAGELYGVERLQQAAARFRQRSVEELAEGILRDVRGFIRDAPPEDDMTLLVLRYEG